MTSTTLALETKVDQPNIETDWLFYIDLSNIDNGTGFTDFTLEAAEMGFEERHPQVQSTNEETHAPPKDIWLAKEASPNLADDGVSTPPLGDLIAAKPRESLAQVHPETVTVVCEEAKRESNPLSEAELIEHQLKLLRCELQTDLLTRLPVAGQMLRMSANLEEAEEIEKLVEFPEDSEFHFKERAANLLRKWKEDQVTKSTTAQPTTDDSTELATVPNSQQPADSPITQHLPKSTLERQAIDLTDTDQSEMVLQAELSYGPTSDRGTQLSAEKIRYSSPSNISERPRTKNDSEATSDMPKARKRNRSDDSAPTSQSTIDGSDIIHLGSSKDLTKAATANINGKNPPRRRTQRKISQTNPTNSMRMLIPKIDNIIKEAEQEIDAVQTKKARLLEENAQEMQCAMGRREVLTKLRENLLELGFLR